MEPKQATPVEDLFERARREFFGTAITSPQRSASSSEFFLPQNETPSPEVTRSIFRRARSKSADRSHSSRARQFLAFGRRVAHLRRSKDVRPSWCRFPVWV